MNTPTLAYLPRFPEDDSLAAEGLVDKSETGIPNVRIFTFDHSTAVLVRGVAMWDLIVTNGAEVEHGLLHPDEVAPALIRIARDSRTGH